MKKTGMMVGAAVLFLAGMVLAELPVPTNAPIQGRYDSFDALSQDLESLQGSVVEMDVVEVALHKTSSMIYGAALMTENGNMASMVFEIPEEAAVKFYRLGGFRYLTDSERQERAPGIAGGKVYFYVTSERFVKPFRARYLNGLEQSFRVIAVGDDFVQNDDGSVRYVWRQVPDSEDLKFEEKWTVEKLLFVGKCLEGSDPVILVDFYAVTGAVKDEVSGEFSGWLTARDTFWKNGIKVRAVFPPEAEKFVEKMEKVRGLDYTMVYVRVEYPPNGELTLRVLGDRMRGRGDDAKYKW